MAVASRLQAEAWSSRRWVSFSYAARATALSFAVAELPVFTWPRAPRRAAIPSSTPSKPFRPQFSKSPTKLAGPVHLSRAGLPGAEKRCRGDRIQLAGGADQAGALDVVARLGEPAGEARAH